jgi:hypothetical protein
VKNNEEGGQSHTSGRLLQQSGMWHRPGNKYYFYTSAFFRTSCFVLSTMDSKVVIVPA